VRHSKSPEARRLEPPTPDSSPAPRLAIVVALDVETRGLTVALEASAGIAIDVLRSGPGAARAGDAARSALANGATALVSWGLAGGLEPGIVPGTVVLPQRIAAPDGTASNVDASWQARLAAALRTEFRVAEGPLLAAEHVLQTPKEKARAALDTGCVAVDMESAAIASAARAADVPVAVVRVVADVVTDTLPRDVESWVGVDGRARLVPLLGALLAPAQWRPLAVLVKRHQVAAAVLTRVARRLVADDFLICEPSSRAV
jgi:adenosylhomocysteine nucleosidase